jgi:hypothetical protein
MDIISNISGSFSFVSAPLFLVAVPLLLLLFWELNRNRRSTAVAMTGVEFLRGRGCMTGRYRNLVKVLLWGGMVLLLAFIWAGPVLNSSTPVLSGGKQVVQKELIVAIDISRSMGQPLEIPDREERFANYGMNQPIDYDDQGKQSRYESARQTFYNFVDRFNDARIGLILFSTEPFLARWPTTETDMRFIEVLEEKIGRGEKSQLQMFSSLTNIDEALRMSREILLKNSNAEGGAVILISDAEDELENMGLAIRALRANGIRLYTIGVGISEVIVEKLAEELGGDAGFRIFHVDSEEEMQEAYDLVSELEESPQYTREEQQFVIDLRWVLALILVFASVGVFWLSETIFHQSWLLDKKL